MSHGPDREGDQVAGQVFGLGKTQSLPAIGGGLPADFARVGHALQAGRDHQRQRPRLFEGRLVEAGERLARAGRLHVADDVVQALGLDLVGAFLFAERRVVGDLDARLAGGNLVGRGKLQHAGGVGERDGQGLLAALRDHLGRIDRHVAAVHPDHAGRRGDVGIDRDLAGKARQGRVDLHFQARRGWARRCAAGDRSAPPAPGRTRRTRAGSGWTRWLPGAWIGLRKDRRACRLHRGRRMC